MHTFMKFCVLISIDFYLLYYSACKSIEVLIEKSILNIFNISYFNI